MGDRNYQYDVFISYRHVPLDKTISGTLHKKLETYPVPIKLKKMGYKSIKRVFRDEEELPLSGILSDTITYALANTRCLVVVCSKDTPASDWVSLEINQFIRLGKAGSIFALLIDGTPETSFPEPLKRIPDIDERILILKSESKQQKIYELNNACAHIVAAALDCNYDQFIKEVSHSKTKRAIKIFAAIICLCLLVGLAAFSQLQAANQSYREADKERKIILSMLSDVAYGFADDPDSFTGSYDEMADTIDENALRIENIIELGGADLDTVTLKVNNYINLAGTWQVMGNMEKALSYSDEAISTAKQYSSKADLRGFLSLNDYMKKYEDPYEAGQHWGTDIVTSYHNLKGQKLLANAYIQKALIQTTAGLDMEAIKNCLKGKAIYELLDSVSGATGESLVSDEENASMYQCLGRCYFSTTCIKAAKENLNMAVQLYDEMNKENASADCFYNKGICLINLGAAYITEGKIKDAISTLEKAEDSCYRAFKMKASYGNAQAIVDCASTYAAALIMNLEPEQAVEKIEKAYEVWKPYDNPDDLLNQYSYILLSQTYAYGLGKSGEVKDSLELLSDLVEYLQGYYKQDDTNLYLKYQLSQTLYMEGYLTITNKYNTKGAKYLKKSVEYELEAYEKSGYSPEYGYKYANNLLSCGQLMAYTCEYETADQYLKKAADVFDRLSTELNNKALKARYHQCLAWQYILQGNTASALAEIQLAKELDANATIRMLNLLLDIDEWNTDAFNKELNDLVEECPFLDEEGGMILDIFGQLGIIPASD